MKTNTRKNPFDQCPKPPASEQSEYAQLSSGVDDQISRLEKCIAVLAEKINMCLAGEYPKPEACETRSQPVESPIGCDLASKLRRIESIASAVDSISSRVKI